MTGATRTILLLLTLRKSNKNLPERRAGVYRSMYVYFYLFYIFSDRCEILLNCKLRNAFLYVFAGVHSHEVTCRANRL
jgi:hypothetical protein